MAQRVLGTEQRSAKRSGPAPGGTTPSRTRHEDDLYTWIQEQVALLRAGRIDEVDLENVAEELSDVGRTEYHRLESALRVLLTHMLKWDQQPEHRTRSWIFSIREQRRRYEQILKQNPGMKARLNEARDAAYPSARDWAAEETHLPVEDFPETCPYEWDDMLNRPFDLDSLKV